MRKKAFLRGLIAIGFLALYAAVAFAVAYIIYLSGEFPQGTQAMYHVYRGDTVYQSINAGVFFPLYDPYWYNGVELLRYFPPLTAYLMAGFEALTSGDIFQAYYLYTSFIVFLSGVAWLSVGRRRGRLILGGLLGVLWFFVPGNLTSYFVEGDLARAFVIALLPLLLHFVVRFMETNDIRIMAPILILYILMLLSHTGFSVMILLALFIYLLLDKFINHRRRGVLAVIICLGVAFMVIGCWLYPSMQGGFLATSSRRIAEEYYQSGFLTLNPVYRRIDGDVWYFGLAFFALAIFGVIASKRRSMPGFWNGIIIFFCTTLLLQPLLSRIPGGDYLWMLRFLPIAVGMILFSFLEWKTLRWWIVGLALVFLVIDVFPSIRTFYKGNQYFYPEARVAELSESILLTEAKGITTQRMAILDAGELGSAPHFITADYGSKTAESYGSGWQAAETSSNLLLIDEAMSEGAYLYVFDRLLELGNDTILIRKAISEMEGKDLEYLDSCAVQRGYYLVDENEEYMLYHYDTELKNFGLVSRYQAIGIGTSSSAVELFYPVMEEGDSDNLSDYTFEELKDYELIYLDHFHYDDLSSAEQLVKDLADAGVRIVINGDGIPSNNFTKVQEFLGAHCSKILFENGYPFLFVNGTRYDLNFFRKGYEDWETVFVNHVDKSLGYFIDNNMEQTFIGSVYNDNITIVGINLIYHYMLTGDPYAYEIISEVIGLDPSLMPERELVPVKVTYWPDSILVETDRDDVNTTLAFHDNFRSEQKIRSEGNLLRVDSGETKITFGYPWLRQGIVLTAFGILFVIMLFGVGNAAFRGEYLRLAEEAGAGKKGKKHTGHEETFEKVKHKYPDGYMDYLDPSSVQFDEEEAEDYLGDCRVAPSEAGWNSIPDDEYERRKREEKPEPWDYLPEDKKKDGTGHSGQEWV